MRVSIVCAAEIHASSFPRKDIRFSHKGLLLWDMVFGFEPVALNRGVYTAPTHAAQDRREKAPCDKYTLEFGHWCAHLPVYKFT
jgi:hypothetical protein